MTSFEGNHDNPKTNEPNRIQNPYSFASHWSTQHPTKYKVKSTTPLPLLITSSISTSTKYLQTNKNLSQTENKIYDFGHVQDSRRTQQTKLKTPSDQYYTPFFQPNYNMDHNTTSNSSETLIHNTKPTSTKPEVILKGKSFVVHQSTISTSIDNNLPIKKSTKVRRTSETEQIDVKQRPSIDSTLIHKLKKNVPRTDPTNHSPAQTANDLLAQYDSRQMYDDASTQGPSIYYEWKIPFITLQDSRIGHSAGSKYSTNKISTVLKKTISNEIKIPTNGLQPPLYTDSTRTLKIKPSSTVAASSTSETPFTDVDLKSLTRMKPLDFSKNTVIRGDVDFSNNNINSKDTNYLELKKLFLIPDYTFPLELNPMERISYENSDSLNSFQVRIPIGRGVTFHAKEGIKNQPAWYGENVECPECHPSFVKPGMCEPCIKIR